jgi:hypothetical protein
MFVPDVAESAGPVQAQVHTGRVLGRIWSQDTLKHRHAFNEETTFACCSFPRSVFTRFQRGDNICLLFFSTECVRVKSSLYPNFRKGGIP